MTETAGAPSATPSKRRQTGRSPSYPAISLDRAVERAKQLYKIEKQFPTPVDSVVKHWGLTTLNGPAGLALAAMKKYGLLTDEGAKEDRRVKLTDLAVQILEHPSTEARKEGIREAALTPSIHREIWAEFGTNLPSDANLIWTLAKDRNFTETGAKEFVREYRETIAYAGLGDMASTDTPAPDTSDEENEVDEDETSDDEAEDKGGRAEKKNEQRRQPPRDGRSAINIPLPNGEFVVVEGKLPLSEQEWSYFLAVLNVMKPGFTGGGAQATDDED